MKIHDSPDTSLPYDEVLQTGFETVQFANLMHYKAIIYHKLQNQELCKLWSYQAWSIYCLALAIYPALPPRLRIDAQNRALANALMWLFSHEYQTIKYANALKEMSPQSIDNPVYASICTKTQR